MTAASRRASRLPFPSVLAAFALAIVLAADPARAGTEEWATFDVIAQEEDDESLLDHLLTRPPSAWRDEWERSVQAMRTSQGCFTSGQWFIDTDLKVRAPMGQRAQFGFDVRDEHTDRSSFTYFDLSLRVMTGLGTPGLMFRPFYDKSRQDFSLFWEAGAETASARARVAFTFEDAFNNLWAFRQTRVGNVSEPYERHPFEPAVGLWLRGDRGRFEVEGSWLTPSRKLLSPVNGETPRETIWGSFGRAGLEVRTGGVVWKASAENRQARSTLTPTNPTGPPGASFRRQWLTETGVSGSLGSRLELEALWLYQERDQGSGAPYPIHSLDAVDRVVQVEGRWTITSHWWARAGAMHDRVTIGRTGPVRSYGTRVESRAYVGLQARFGQVSLSAVEGIELDPEPYDVWWVHDKAFLHIQATF